MGSWQLGPDSLGDTPPTLPSSQVAPLSTKLQLLAQVQNQPKTCVTCTCPSQLLGAMLSSG